MVSNEFEDKVVVHDLIVRNKLGDLPIYIPDNYDGLMGASGVHGLYMGKKEHQGILLPALALDNMIWTENLGRSCEMKVYDRSGSPMFSWDLI